MIRKTFAFGKALKACFLVLSIYANLPVNTCFAQANLVQNGGFEDRDTTYDGYLWGRSEIDPPVGDQLQYHCLHWRRNFSRKTPDYFNTIVGGTCSVGIPNNQLG